MFAPYPSNRNAHDFETVVANPDVSYTTVTAQNYGRTYDLAGSGNIILSNAPGPTIMRGMNIHGSLTVNKYLGAPLPTYPRTLRFMLCGGVVMSDGLAARSLETNFAFEGDIGLGNDNPVNLFTVSGTSRFGFNWFPIAVDSPTKPTTLTVNDGVSVTGYRPIHTGGTVIATGGSLKWFHMPVNPLAGTIEDIPVADVSGGGTLILASDLPAGSTTTLSNVTVAYIIVDSGIVVIASGQSFAIWEVLLGGVLRMEGTAQVTSSLDINGGGLECANTSGADANIIGDLVFSADGRVKFAQGGESSGSSWLPTTVGAIAVGGDLNFDSVSSVFLSRMPAGTYTIFTHAGTRTGTLPDPILSGGGATPGFSTYNYNANSVEVVFV